MIKFMKTNATMTVPKIAKTGFGEMTPIAPNKSPTKAATIKAAVLLPLPELLVISILIVYQVY